MAETYLNDILLDCETVSDDFEKAVSKQHIPFSDDVYLTDMGLKERKIKIRCYFWADTYEKHKELLALLWGQTDFELKHPVYGLLKGKVESISIRSDDRLNTVEIDIGFVVGKSNRPEPVSSDIEGESEDLYISGMREIEKDYRDEMVSGSVLPGEVIDGKLNPDFPMLEQMPVALGPEGRTYVRQLDVMVNRLNSSAAGVSLPGGSLLSDINLGIGIPGRIISTLAAFALRQVAMFSSLRSSPDRFFASLKSGLMQFSGMLPDSTNERAYASTAALSASRELSLVYAEDETLRIRQKRLETVKIFDDLGRMNTLDRQEYPMNAVQVEKTLYTVREMNVIAIAGDREITSLKLLSDKLLDHVSKIKLNREKIIRVEVDNEIPLHLVCLKYGLPYQSADRIMLINRIKHPSFTQGGVDIYGS